MTKEEQPLIQDAEVVSSVPPTLSGKELAVIASEPARYPGAKIENSPYRDQIAAFLLMKRGKRYCLEFLEEQKFDVVYATVKGFEINYVSKLSQDMRDALTAPYRAEEAKRNAEIVTQAVHARVSRVESIIRSIEGIEEQKEELESRGSLMSSFDHMAVLKCVDQIQKYRLDLEHALMESEIEKERVNAITQVVAIALEYLKDRPEEVQQFAKRIAAIRVHRKA